MSECFDIAIIGGGIVGASLAHALEGRRSVILLEREDALDHLEAFTGGSRGISALSRSVRPAKPYGCPRADENTSVA